MLIDALDEAMSRREGDAVDTILAQLESAGSPDFILSCRAREWQTRSEINLRRIYGPDPNIFRLEPLSRAEARLFLVSATSPQTLIMSSAISTAAAWPICTETR